LYTELSENRLDTIEYNMCFIFQIQKILL